MYQNKITVFIVERNLAVNINFRRMLKWASQLVSRWGTQSWSLSKDCRYTLYIYVTRSILTVRTLFLYTTITDWSLSTSCSLRSTKWSSQLHSQISGYKLIAHAKANIYGRYFISAHSSSANLLTPFNTDISSTQTFFGWVSQGRGRCQGTAWEGQLVYFRMSHQGELFKDYISCKRLASVTSSWRHDIWKPFCTICTYSKTSFKGAKHYGNSAIRAINFWHQPADFIRPVIMEHSSTLGGPWLRQLLPASHRGV